MTDPADRWDQGSAYDRFMGRWSLLVAEAFVRWLAVPPGSWLDVGCGTGALLATAAATASPTRLAGVDPSHDFLAVAATRLPAADLRVADAQSLPFDDGEFDVVASGLVLNFVPDPAAAVREMRRVARPGGVFGAYVWDYADGMGFLRTFWDAVIELDPAAAHLDEGRRFSISRAGALAEALRAAGLTDVTGTAIEIPTHFAGFDDYWQPFLGSQGPAGAYLAMLDAERRSALRDRLSANLEPSADGSIHLTARAWAAQGIA